MDDDDIQVGRILNRREVLALFGVGGAAALLAACSGGSDDASSPTQPASTASTATEAQPTATTVAGATSASTGSAPVPSCVVKPALTEGPYFVDEKINRSDIRSDTSDGSVRPGLPLTLAFNVSKISAGACDWLANAQVDVWHCDATGVYSDASDPGFNTKGKTFLRGYQMTSANGLAKFTTVYPGWYQGRAVHIHFKIRSANSEFTSQLFFDDALSDTVFAQSPYNTKSGTANRLKNAGDGIYREGGSQLIPVVTKTADGYAATFDIGLRL